MMPLLVEALSSLLFDGSDVVASRRSFVGSSLSLAEAIRCSDAVEACRDASNDAR